MVKNKNKIKTSSVVFTVISIAVLSIYCLILLTFLFWGLLTSVKAKFDYTFNPSGFFPSSKFGWHFENYATAFRTMVISQDLAMGETRYVKAPTMLFNSLVWAVGSAFLNTFTTCLVSYCCAKYSKKLFSKIIYAVVVVSITVPIIGSLPSQMQLVNALGLYDNPLLIFAFKTSFNTTYFLVFYATFANIPKAYSESAELDGAGQWTIYFKIVLPLVLSVALVVFVMFFIAYWNEYTIPMLYFPSYPTIAQGLYEYQNSRSPEATAPVKLAASFIVCFPSFVLFICFRDKIMTNIRIGGLKG